MKLFNFVFFFCEWMQLRCIFLHDWIIKMNFAVVQFFFANFWLIPYGFHLCNLCTSTEELATENRRHECHKHNFFLWHFSVGVIETITWQYKCVWKCTMRLFINHRVDIVCGVGIKEVPYIIVSTKRYSGWDFWLFVVRSHINNKWERKQIFCVLCEITLVIVHGVSHEEMQGEKWIVIRCFRDFRAIEKLGIGLRTSRRNFESVITYHRLLQHLPLNQLISHKRKTLYSSI